MEAPRGSINRAPVEVREHEAAWRDDFRRRAQLISGALGAVAARVEHVGSTAVPGLAAKPTIDIQVSVPDLADLDSYRRPLEKLGYTFHERSLGEPEHRFFSAPRRAAYVHVCPAGSSWERTRLLFRDHLRAHRADATAYAELKRRLAQAHPADREAYNRGKVPFIEAAMARAEAWARTRGRDGDA